MVQAIEQKLDASRVHRNIASLRKRALSFEDSPPRGERLRLVTESYKQTEGQGVAVRRAKAVAHTFTNNEIQIRDDELFAGLPQRSVYGSDSLHFNNPRHWESAMDYPELTGGIFPVHKEIPEDLQKHLDYWQAQKLARAVVAENMTPEIKKAIEFGALAVSGWVQGHSNAGFDRVLQLGLEGIKAEAESKLTELQSAGTNEGQDFLKGVLIACDGVIQHAKRYANLARDTAASESDSERKSELLRIADTCDRVPAQPANNFHEALQCIWFVQRGVDMEMGDAAALANGWGRVDQYLYPYYRSDIDSGHTTDEEVRLLLTEFYLKLNRAYQDTLILLGGLTAGGEDGTNELSYMLMEIHRDQGLLIDIDARVHSNTPSDFVHLCAEVTQKNLGFSFFNDEPTIAALERIGIPQEIAVQYSPVGCVENIVPGYATPTTMDNQVNVAKCLELALNDGVCMLTSTRIGPETGDPASFKSFADVWDAFVTQLNHLVDLGCQGTSIVQKGQAGRLPLPFYSATWWDPISKAKDLTEGGARYPHSGCNNVGLSTAADSLTAIKQLVFEKHKIDWNDLLDGLRTDFAGKTDLQNTLLDDAPKYGNDDDEADQMASDVHMAHYAALEDKVTAFGGRYLLLIFNTNHLVVVSHGSRTAATPDGRSARKPVGISVSPSEGRDVSGPKAAMRSICKLDQTAIPGGASYIMELNTKHIENSDGDGVSTDRLAELLQYYIDLGGMNLAINVLDPEWIEEVMNDPTSNPNLSARLYGWSQYVKNLDPRLQEFLLDRTRRSASV